MVASLTDLTSARGHGTAPRPNDGCLLGDGSRCGESAAGARQHPTPLGQYPRLL